MLTLAGCMLAAACSKENNGLLELSAEGYGSAAKTSVSGLTVQWESGDQVRLNRSTYSVSVSDGKAYVSSSLSGEVYGWSPASLVGATWTRTSHVLSFTFPSEYTCTYSAGRQKIDLPMAAYASSASDGVCFRHLSAGIRVLTTNLTEQALVLDSVVVSSALYKLSGYVTATLADDAAPAIEAESGSGRVVVRMGEDVSLAASHADTVEVQVPIRPIGEGDLTIEVYAHRRGDAVSISGVPTVYKSVRYHFSGTHSSSALGRNVLLTAGVRLGESTPSEEVDHSLFSVAAERKVRFAKGNLQYTDGAWQFAADQYTTLAGQSDDGRDLFGWGTSSNPNLISSSTGDYTTFNDWGNNTISGATGFRTLTAEEWAYLLGSRGSASYAKANLMGEHYGLILLPDDYEHPSGLAAIVGLNEEGNNSWSANQYTSGEWAQMEAAGAVFLPAAGYRVAGGNNMISAGSQGCYWSSTASGTNNATRLLFNETELTASNTNSRSVGCSVRLVKNEQ